MLSWWLQEVWILVVKCIVFLYSFCFLHLAKKKKKILHKQASGLFYCCSFVSLCDNTLLLIMIVLWWFLVSGRTSLISSLPSPSSCSELPWQFGDFSLPYNFYLIIKFHINLIDPHGHRMPWLTLVFFWNGLCSTESQGLAGGASPTPGCQGPLSSRGS